MYVLTADHNEDLLKFLNWFRCHKLKLCCLLLLLIIFRYNIHNQFNSLSTYKLWGGGAIMYTF